MKRTGFLLLSAILIGPPAAGRAAQSPESSTATTRKVDTVVSETADQLGRVRPGTERDQAIATLVKHGDDTVAEIKTRLEKGQADFGWHHNAVRVLKAIKTNESRTTLRRMALGKYHFKNVDNQRWAAQALVEVEPDAAWPLLNSTGPNVLQVALSTVTGQPIRKDYLPQLKTCLASKDRLVSGLAADVLAGDPTGKFAGDALAAIGQALAAVPNLPDANDFDERGLFLGTEMTVAEEYYDRYSVALMRVRIDNGALHTLAAGLKGRARDAVTRALALRGDKSVRQDILKLAQDPQAEMFRVWATQALREVGTADDLPLLRTLAERDPLVREGLLPPPHPMHSRGDTYPVRAAAKDTIASLEPRPAREREKSLAQCVSDAQVIIVATALDSSKAPPKAPGDQPEHLIRFRVKRVLKGDLAKKVIVTRTPTDPQEFLGKTWVVMLSPEYVAGKNQFADCQTAKVEGEVSAILRKATP